MLLGIGTRARIMWVTSSLAAAINGVPARCGAARRPASAASRRARSQQLFAADTNNDQISKISPSVRNVSHFTFAARANSAMAGTMPAKARVPPNVSTSSSAISSMSAWSRNLDVSALVEVLDRERERLERLAPQLVDPLVAAAMKHEPPSASASCRCSPHWRISTLSASITIPNACSSTALVKISAARLNSAPASIAPLTRCLARSVSESKACRASARRRPGMLSPCST